MTFIEALKGGDLDSIRSFPKADLHNHFVLGGNRDYIFHKTGYEIEPISAPLKSMREMDAWSSKFIGDCFHSSSGRKLLIEATFAQAKHDGVAVLEIGEDVWGLGEFFHNDVGELIAAFQEANDRIAPEIDLRLQIGLSRHCPVDYLSDCLKRFWGRKEFYSIDLYGDELAQPIENFIPIYEKAAESGLVLKAHVGEWGTARDIVAAVKSLHLNEVQHGIAAVHDESVVDFLAENKIRLNITPSSNVLLGRVPDMARHPIAQLYRKGVDVTINSDDVLIFDSDVSKEYLRLYQSGCLTAEELDDIRQKSLNIDLTGYCGVDCADCTDYTEGKCPGCRESTWPEGDECKPITCCKGRGIAYCGACAEFPCDLMREFYEESEGHRRAYERMKSVCGQE